MPCGRSDTESPEMPPIIFEQVPPNLPEAQDVYV